eukprot:CAMPEP_0171495718 /NCGR_PEP_ID=MMETSP0958-20121227/6294_1 /TAXON_ID=87120 /ORGANISM="Aurantiochytrium limacinum, Strain ATCCMYA-1381" /LENGTH=136 /DNA_ID=CAMNT_0012029725 /DNA_START=491 /DNA_END=901 /DNA_ORIENTATION=+
MACCSSKEGSICCGLFSFVGAIFLGVLGMLLTFQWEYVHGINSEEDAEHARRNAFVAAGIYAVIFFMCMISLVLHNKHDYKAINTTPTIPEQQNNNIELENVQQNNGSLNFGLLAGDSLAPNGNGRPVTTARVAVQ